MTTGDTKPPAHGPLLAAHWLDSPHVDGKECSYRTEPPVYERLSSVRTMMLGIACVVIVVALAAVVAG
ncbi:hypothetical protein OG302_01970 [Streptomyces sp. NBC_01283]|uniref:hypothetical protein n=1 Tax=Streptomyces sp. NBC_01283 TaxID=2903812 RepID=UPI00352D3D08|nr:hypothetical protein OG302_01970 [Streptomyces sp. NBC_01283]